MAQKNTRSYAERAASSKGKKKTAEQKQTSVKNTYTSASKAKKMERTVPVRVITAIVCAVLFVVFLVALLQPDGVAVKLFRSFVVGLIGNIGFYVAIPALLYLFAIQAFSGKRPIILRSICLIVFVLLCGCISQLHLPAENLPEGFAILPALYDGAMDGNTAGLICGGFALVMKLLCGSVLSYIIFIVAALLTFLASCQITIPSIVRAIQNRPRADWEDDEIEEVEEPAAVVVNHIANKRIAYVENKRKLQAERAQIDVPVDEEPVLPPTGPKRKISREVNDFMNQVDSDVESPVAVAKDAVTEDTNVDLILDSPFLVVLLYHIYLILRIFH